MSTCRALEILDGQLEGPPVLSSPLVNSTVYQMEQTRAFYPLAHQIPEKMVRLAESIHTLFGFQGIRIPFDLCVEAEALGCEIKMGGDPAFPFIARSLQVPPEPFKLPKHLFATNRFPVVFQSAHYLYARYKNDIPLYAGCVAPFTLGGYLWEAKNFFTLPLKDPQRLRSVLKWLADLVANYAKRLIQAGANVIVLVDPSASSNIISPAVFERFLLPVYNRLRQNIPGRIILHICGDTRAVLDLIGRTGFAGFSFEGPCVTVEAARQALGRRIALVGNIPTSDSLLYGTPSQVKQDVLRALMEGVHLLAPACSIPPQTPPENLLVLSQVVGDYLKQTYGTALN